MNHRNSKTFSLFLVIFLFESTITFADVINPDGAQFVPSVDILERYTPSYPSAIFSISPQSTYTSGPQWNTNLQLRIPITSYLSCNVAGSYQDFTTTNSNQDSTTYAYQSSYGAKFFSSPLFGSYPGVWGIDSGPYGRYWAPNLSVAYLSYHNFDTQWTGPYGFGPETQDSENYLISAEIPAPWNTLLGISVGGNIQVRDYLIENFPGPPIGKGTKEVSSSIEQEPSYPVDVSLKFPINWRNLHGKPDFNVDANPDGWTWVPILAYDHLTDFYDEIPRNAVDSVQIFIPCNSTLTLKIGLSYAQSLPPTEPLLGSNPPETVTWDSNLSYFAGLTIYP
jgi:hypothetical protein